MKVVGSFNKISDKLKKEIPILKPGETAVFQMLNGIPNPDPDSNEKIKNPMLFGKTQLQTGFRIFDPYLKDDEGKETGGYVDVGAVEIWNKDQPERFKMFVAGYGPHQFQGKFQLIGGKIEDQELFEVFWLSNEREGNPHRDKTVKPMFKIVNNVADGKATLTKVDKLREALNLVANMKEQDARIVWAALNKKNFKDIGELMPALSEYVKSNPEPFLEAYSDPDKKQKAVIKEAFDKSILEHDVMSGDITMGNEKLTNASVTEDLLTTFNAWVKSANNGEQVFGLIKKKLNKKAEIEPAS
jgi:hypothetical protein